MGKGEGVLGVNFEKCQARRRRGKRKKLLGVTCTQKNKNEASGKKEGANLTPSGYLFPQNTYLSSVVEIPHPLYPPGEAKPYYQIKEQHSC